MKNKFGVPYHQYEIVLDNGDTKLIDIGRKEDWCDIQQMFKDTDFGKMVECVGWGNDFNVHIEIISVIDIENHDRSMNPLEWAKDHVWVYVDNYCQ